MFKFIIFFFEILLLFVLLLLFCLIVFVNFYFLIDFFFSLYVIFSVFLYKSILQLLGIEVECLIDLHNSLKFYTLDYDTSTTFFIPSFPPEFIFLAGVGLVALCKQVAVQRNLSESSSTRDKFAAEGLLVLDELRRAPAPTSFKNTGFKSLPYPSHSQYNTNLDSSSSPIVIVSLPANLSPNDIFSRITYISNKQYVTNALIIEIMELWKDEQIKDLSPKEKILKANQLIVNQF